jgi:hypothetical protein
MHDTATLPTSTARTIGFGVLAGALGGLVVAGVGGRLFMFVLAELNTEDAGVLTDDGFAMGQFTLSGTLNLLSFTTAIGIVGGLLFVGLRGLRFGPAWFRTLSMPVGVAIVAGSLLVHSEGVDFTLLQPWWLAVSLTLAVPFVYTLMVSALADRWIGDGQSVWSRVPVAVPWVVRACFVALIAIALVDLVSTIDTISNPYQFD